MPLSWYFAIVGGSRRKLLGVLFTREAADHLSFQRYVRSKVGCRLSRWAKTLCINSSVCSLPPSLSLYLSASSIFRCNEDMLSITFGIDAVLDRCNPLTLCSKTEEDTGYLRGVSNLEGCR